MTTRWMGGAKPRKYAGHDVSCPYEEKIGRRTDTLRCSSEQAIVCATKGDSRSLRPEGLRDDNVRGAERRRKGKTSGLKT